MRYEVRLVGVSPVIMHSRAAGLDTGSPLSLEIAAIAKKRGSNRTEADNLRLRELETRRALHLDERERPFIPAAALRATIEAAAKKTKQGGNVREGLLVESTEFKYDEDRYGTGAEALAKSTQFVAPVVVQRAAVLRTRAKFDTPWALVAKIDVDDEIIDKQMLGAFLDVAGRRCGILDWRPACSGIYGRFSVESVKAIGD